MRKLLSACLALLLAGGIAFATNIPLYKGPIQPGNLLDALNNLVLQINADTPGLSQFIAGPISSTATTLEQTLASTTIPAAQIVSAGQGLRLRCAGTTAADTNTKTVHLYFGNFEYSSAAFSTSAENWDLEILINAAATPATADSVGVGHGTTGTTVVAPVATNDTADNWQNAIAAKCTVTQGNASANDTTLETFLIEQIK